MDRRRIVTGLAAAPLLAAHAPGAAAAEQDSDWKQALARLLPLYGHRNWIVVADSAYPAQSRPSITTLVSQAEYFDVLATVLRHISSSRHVRPIVYQDSELAHLTDNDAPGVSGFRQQVAPLIGDQVQSLPHEEIIGKLDEAGKLFEILIIKTTLTIPYTTVFLQLDCAYWNAAQERALRAGMQAKR